VRDGGGHSSLPTPQNPIERLARALQRLAEHALRTNSATRAYCAALAALHEGTLAADMRTASSEPADPAALLRLAASSAYNNAQLRSTCIPALLGACRT